MLLYLIRHGETDFNVMKRLQGRMDEPLNQKGIDLAVVTGRGLRGVHFDLAITSPLLRAKQTASLVLENSGNEGTPLLEDEHLIEISFGDWEGLCCADAHYEIPEPDFYQFFRDPFLMKRFPNGEHVEDVILRTGAFLRELLAREDLQEKTILLSSHGCACRAMLNGLYDDPKDFWHGRVPYNCAVNIIEGRNGNAKILEADKVYYDRGQIVDRYKK